MSAIALIAASACRTRPYPEQDRSDLQGPPATDLTAMATDLSVRDLFTVDLAMPDLAPCEIQTSDTTSSNCPETSCDFRRDASCDGHVYEMDCKSTNAGCQNFSCRCLIDSIVVQTVRWSVSVSCHLQRHVFWKQCGFPP